MLHIDRFLKKKFEEHGRIQLFLGINGAKSIYVNSKYHDYADKKTRCQPKHITDVPHKNYVFFLNLLYLNLIIYQKNEPMSYTGLEKSLEAFIMKN